MAFAVVIYIYYIAWELLYAVFEEEKGQKSLAKITEENNKTLAQINQADPFLKKLKKA